jgi:hypothetical protein
MYPCSIFPRSREVKAWRSAQEDWRRRRAGCAASRPIGSRRCSVRMSICRRRSARRSGAGSFSPSRVFWLFLAQAFAAGGPCREAVRRLGAWLAALRTRSGQDKRPRRRSKKAPGKARTVISPRTAGYCKARKRLPQKDLDAVHAALAKSARSERLGRGLWRGRPVKVVDGSGLSMPDTPQNQALYPQTKRARKGCSFPVMRVVALFCLGTGVLIDLAKGSLFISERALFRALWGLLEAGDVILADRGFCGFAEFLFLKRRGVDCVMRAHQRRTVGKSRHKRLGKGDWLVLWHRSKPAPNWIEKALWQSLPATMLVREITFTVPVKAFRTRSITVATTLLDPVEFPAEAFAELYRRRWQVELFLRDIKITTGMDILTCKTPAMIHKELTMHQIAYNLIRLTMLEAAAQREVPVETLSFKGTLASLREWAPHFSALPSRARRNLWTSLLDAIASDPLPHRPNRAEPRARKRRPKNHQLLNKPRRFFKEIHHRNRYTKR